MSKLNVDTESLKSYGTSLDTKAQEFSEITKKMQEIVESLRISWGGSDANSFIANATEYINNLKVIENSLISYGSTVKRRSSGYDKRVADFYARLRG